MGTPGTILLIWCAMDKAAVANEQRIKKAIMDGRTRGVCDRNGNTIPREKRGYVGKGDWNRVEDKRAFDDNYDKIDWSVKE